MHRHHRFADSNRHAHELRAFLPQASFSEIVQRIGFTPASANGAQEETAEPQAVPLGGGLALSAVAAALPAPRRGRWRAS